jgi:hypothetical protein
MSTPDAIHIRKGLKIIAMLVMAGWITWSGFRPGREDSAKWYDRAIRAVGGLMILAVLIAGLFVTMFETN